MGVYVYVDLKAGYLLVKLTKIRLNEELYSTFLFNKNNFRNAKCLPIEKCRVKLTVVGNFGL